MTLDEKKDVTPIRFIVITLFPEVITPYLNTGMMWKAQDRGLAEFEVVYLREFGLGVHRSVDDTPCGGGDGMLLRCEPAFAAIESVKSRYPDAQVIIPTPCGSIWNQAKARSFAENEDCRNYIILCPRYEGYDERIMTIVDHPVSMGKFVLTGGELPALSMIDSVVRLVPGVLGSETSAVNESFSDGNNLEYPQYTKPAEFRGMRVPEVLLSGHHANIAKWREEHAKVIEE